MAFSPEVTPDRRRKYDRTTRTFWLNAQGERSGRTFNGSVRLESSSADDVLRS